MTTRRTLLTAIGLAPLATLPAVAAVSETPEQKLIRLTEEIMALSAEIYPIDSWLVHLGGTQGGGVIIHGMSHKLYGKGEPEVPLLYRKRIYASESS